MSNSRLIYFTFSSLFRSVEYAIALLFWSLFLILRLGFILNYLLLFYYISTVSIVFEWFLSFTFVAFYFYYLCSALSTLTVWYRDEVSAWTELFKERIGNFSFGFDKFFGFTVIVAGGYFCSGYIKASNIDWAVLEAVSFSKASANL